MGLLEDRIELHILVENLRRDLQNARRTSSLIVSGFSPDKLTERLQRKMKGVLEDFDWIQSNLEAYARWQNKNQNLNRKRPKG